MIDEKRLEAIEDKIASLQSAFCDLVEVVFASHRRNELMKKLIDTEIEVRKTQMEMVLDGFYKKKEEE